MLDRLFLPPLVMMCGMDFGCSRGSLADADPRDLNLIIFINVFFFNILSYLMVSQFSLANGSCSRLRVELSADDEDGIERPGTATEVEGWEAVNGRSERCIKR